MQKLSRPFRFTQTEQGWILEGLLLVEKGITAKEYKDMFSALIERLEFDNSEVVESPD